jgi:cell division protein FtsN
VPPDYKHRAQKKPEKKPLPGWLWLLTGLLLGGFVAALFWLHGQSDDAGAGWVGAPPDRPPQGGVAPVDKPVPPRQPERRYDFYDLLPRMEVQVPEREPEAPPAPAPSVAAPDLAYDLQVGSFKRPEDADRRKAELALLGYEVRVARARIDDEMHYRVRLGPYRGRSEVEQARRRLAASGFDSIVVRAPGP